MPSPPPLPCHHTPSLPATSCLVESGLLFSDIVAGSALSPPTKMISVCNNEVTNEVAVESRVVSANATAGKLMIDEDVTAYHLLFAKE
jgi:hypothetical protein